MKRFSTHQSLRSILICSLTLCFSVTFAYAGGFAVLEQSGRGLGQAFAGATTGFGDGSEVYFNPAALTENEGDLVHLGSNLIYPQANYDDEGSTLAAALGGGAVGGPEGGNGGELAYVPNVYLVKGLADDQLKLAFAINSPFGLLSSWDRDWVGRYHAVKSDLLTVNLNPSLAYRINENISVGGGVNAMYADAKLTNAIDFGTIGVAALGPTAVAAGLVPQGADGFGEVTGDDWGVGYNLGALFTCEDTKVGVHYRSKINLILRGDAEFDVPTAALPLTATGSFVNTGASARATLPETIAFDVHHQVTDRWGLAFGAIWTRWNRLQELRVQYDSTQPDTVTELNWNPTWRFAWGTDYKLTDVLTVRGGLSTEKTPIASGVTRTPRIPDDDRFWLTTGASLALSDSLSLDFSYAHIFMNDTDSLNVSSTGNVLDGNYDLSIDIAAVSLTWQG